MKQPPPPNEVLRAIRSGYRPPIVVVTRELIRLKQQIAQILERERDPREHDRIALRRIRRAVLEQHGELKAYLKSEEQRRTQERQERVTP